MFAYIPIVCKLQWHDDALEFYLIEVDGQKHVVVSGINVQVVEDRLDYNPALRHLVWETIRDILVQHDKPAEIKLDSRRAKAIEFVGRNWRICDGEHHKQWLIDQIMRILLGNDYERWVMDYPGDHSYEDWQEGIAP